MVVAAKAKELIGAAVDLLYPRNCQFCQQPLARHERGVICAACLATVKWIEPPCCSRCALPFVGAVDSEFECGYCKELGLHFSRGVAACLARGIVLNAIHEFKYNRKMYFGQHLAEWIVTGGRKRVDWSGVDAIVPVPLHPRKKREREFNQAEYLADTVGAAFAKPVWKHSIRRVKDTPTQTLLSREERMDNLRHAFETRDSTVLKRKRVVLVDDVFTTGATLDACARVLRVAGAADVWVLTVARGAYV
jgi:ComF family protein